MWAAVQFQSFLGPTATLTRVAESQLMQSLLVKPLAEVTLNDLSANLEELSSLGCEEAEGLSHATLSAKSPTQQVSCETPLDQGDSLCSQLEVFLLLSLMSLRDQSSDTSLDDLCS